MREKCENGLTSLKRMPCDLCPEQNRGENGWAQSDTDREKRVAVSKVIKGKRKRIGKLRDKISKTVLKCYLQRRPLFRIEAYTNKITHN